MEVDFCCDKLKMLNDFQAVRSKILCQIWRKKEGNHVALLSSDTSGGLGPQTVWKRPQKMKLSCNLLVRYRQALRGVPLWAQGLATGSPELQRNEKLVCRNCSWERPITVAMAFMQTQDDKFPLGLEKALTLVLWINTARWKGFSSSLAERCPKQRLDHSPPLLTWESMGAPTSQKCDISPVT